MMNVRVTELDNSRKTMYNDLGFMKTQISDKVDNKDLKAVEQKVQDCAPWESVRSVYKELSFYLKKDDFELNKQDVESKMFKLQK